MKRMLAAFTLILAGYHLAIAQAELASDCTVTFNVSMEDAKADPKVKQSMAGATKIVYIKGTRTRSDLLTAGFNQTTLTDSKSDTVIILREFGTAKYITYLFGDKRSEKNKKFEGIIFKDSEQKKTILGYECKKAIATLKDGSAYEAFYTPLITPSIIDYENQFRNLPGFVLEYDSLESNTRKIKYIATNISFSPVPFSKFDVPVAGYRIL